MTKTVRLLFGSQNFGFNVESSDKDFFEFSFPTWSDLLNSKLRTKEVPQEDGSVVKEKDVRLFLPMLKKANVNDLQVLFSQETENAEVLNWFFENRNRLCLMNPAESFFTNRGYATRLLKNCNNGKDFARASSAVLFLESCKNGNPQCLFPELAQTRKDFDTWSQEQKEQETESLLARLESMKEFFVSQTFDEELWRECEEEMVRLLKENLTSL